MPQPCQRILVCILCVLLLTGTAIAQPSNGTPPQTDSLSRYIQMKYGLDQELINGFQYYVRNAQFKGNPFFPEDTFYSGSVSLRGTSYDNVQLKYDSYFQHLILAYTDFEERYNQLILNSIHIDSFRLGTACFQNLNLAGQNEMFYQILKSGPLTCYIHWKREAHTLDYDYDFKYTHEYSRPIGTFYISHGDQIQAFNNRKSFIAFFPESLHRELKKYFKKQQFQFREAVPEDFQDLLNVASSLLENSTRH